MAELLAVLAQPAVAPSAVAKRGAPAAAANAADA
jgi:hypothetical protein